MKKSWRMGNFGLVIWDIKKKAFDWNCFLCVCVSKTKEMLLS